MPLEGVFYSRGESACKVDQRGENKTPLYYNASVGAGNVGMGERQA